VHSFPFLCSFLRLEEGKARNSSEFRGIFLFLEELAVPFAQAKEQEGKEKEGIPWRERFETQHMWRESINRLMIPIVTGSGRVEELRRGVKARRGNGESERAVQRRLRDSPPSLRRCYCCSRPDTDRWIQVTPRRPARWWR